MTNAIIVTGQTATGKTDLALEIARTNNGELINIDSRQLYKDIDIISGKDTPPDAPFTLVSTIDSFDIGYYIIDGIKIWLYDVARLDQVVSSFHYKKLVSTLLTDFFPVGKTPIFIGGTYLYIKSLIHGFETELIPPNEKLRDNLNNKSVDELQDLLIKIDSDYFQSLNNSEKNNPQRLIRKIEIMQFLKDNQLQDPSPIVKTEKFIGLEHKNEKLLKSRIKKRVEKRMEQGAIDEVMRLPELGYLPSSIGLTAIGCKQIIAYLAKQYTLEEMKEKWIESEVAYAKRQLTFMKKDKNINWHTV